jgi:hypothetical protein
VCLGYQLIWDDFAGLLGFVLLQRMWIRMKVAALSSKITRDGIFTSIVWKEGNHLLLMRKAKILT